MPSSEPWPFDRNEIDHGDYWLAGEEHWPVVICDEEIVEKYFRGIRPQNAARADGSWDDRHKANGPNVSKRVYPCLYAGTLKRSWVPVNQLALWEDGNTLFETNELIKPPGLNLAMEEVYECLEKGHDLSYWKDRLFAKSLHIDVDSPSPPESFPGNIVHSFTNPLENRKRKSMAGMEFPPSFTSQQAMDDDELQPEPKIKKEFRQWGSSGHDLGLYDNDDDESRRSVSSKRSRLDSSGGASPTASRPLPSQSSFRYPTPFRAMSTFSRVPEKKPALMDPTKACIYVGNPHSAFRISRSSLDASPLLLSLLSLHSEKGWYIMSPFLSDLNAEEFKPVAEFLEYGDYTPNILGENTVNARLEGLSIYQQHEEEVARCATVYKIAHTLELSILKNLVFRKVKILTDFKVQTSLAVLTVFGSVFEIAAPEMRLYLNQYVAKYFWFFILNETDQMADIMQSNEDLARGVFAILSGGATPEESVKSDQDVTDEKKKENTGSELSEVKHEADEITPEGQQTREEALVQMVIERSKLELE